MHVATLAHSVCAYLLVHVGGWEGHPDVAEMMMLQRVGLKKIPQGEELKEEEEEEEVGSSDEFEDELGLKQLTSTANRFAKLSSSEFCDS